MEYNINHLPDFYSVRNKEAIDYSFEGMHDKKCLVFFDNGFKSTKVSDKQITGELVWDGFLLFLNKNISLKDINEGIGLFDERLVGLQRMDNNIKANNAEIKEYIIDKLEKNNIDYELMNDENLVTGNCIRYDMWSTRNNSVINDAMDCIGNASVNYFPNDRFNFKISFNKSLYVAFNYEHVGEVVLENNNQIIVIKLLNNKFKLKDKMDGLIEKGYEITLKKLKDI